jgi:hypothetical protein
MRFRATIELGGKTATGIRVPEEIVAGLGAGKRPAVRVTINGHTYRSTVAPMSGKFMLPISAENRASAGVVAGDDVDVDIELDTEPREVAVPPDFVAALKRDADARRTFENLSYSRKQWHVLSIEGTKTRRDPAATHRKVDQHATRRPGSLNTPPSPTRASHRDPQPSRTAMRTLCRLVVDHFPSKAHRFDAGHEQPGEGPDDGRDADGREPYE